MCPVLVKPVLFYEREFYCFSNFSAFAVKYRGFWFATAEHAYQFSKFDDKDIQTLILNAKSAHEAKQIAKKYKSEVRKDWSEVKLAIMEEIINLKIEQHAYVKEMLLKTGDRLIVEDSPVDGYWGWGPDREGQNHLGKIWMKARAKIQ